MPEASDAELKEVTSKVTGWVERGTSFSPVLVKHLVASVNRLSDLCGGATASDEADPVVEEATPNRSG